MAPRGSILAPSPSLHLLGSSFGVIFWGQPQPAEPPPHYLCPCCSLASSANEGQASGPGDLFEPTPFTSYPRKLLPKPPSSPPTPAGGAEPAPPCSQLPSEPPR